MTVYGYTGADVHAEAQAHNDTLMSSVFEYASGFGNTPVYIGMDANTDNLSSSSLSQVSLSQRWFDVGSHFAYLQNETPSPTCFAKGNPAGRRIDYIFANSPAVNAIQEFTLETAVPIPTHRPLCITILAHLFSSSIGPSPGLLYLLLLTLSHDPLLIFLTFFLTCFNGILMSLRAMSNKLILVGMNGHNNILPC